jgi:signal peptidase II
VKKSTAYRGLSLVIVLLVAADWLTKLWITNRLALGETWALVDGWLYFVHRQNPGVAFSVFADLPAEWRVPLLSALSGVGVVLFTWIMLSTRDRLARIAASLVLAGALGNLGDRVWTGEVTDFVFLAFFPFVFNLADAAITAGGSILAVRMAVAGDDPGPGRGAELTGAA